MIVDCTNISMDKICRSCLSENVELRALFSEKEILPGQTLQLADMMMACTAIEVNIIDKY